MERVENRERAAGRGSSKGNGKGGKRGSRDSNVEYALSGANDFGRNGLATAAVTGTAVFLAVSSLL